jgi:hypothetical protein
VKAVSEDVIKIIPVDPDFVPKKEIVEKAKSFLEPRHTPSPSASTKVQGRRRLETLVNILVKRANSGIRAAMFRSDFEGL